MTHGQNVPHTLYPDDQSRLNLLTGILSGLTCMALGWALYRMIVLIVGRLFGSPTNHAAGAGAIASRWWLSGLLVAFVFFMFLLASAQARSRVRFSAQQCWTATIFVGTLSLVASFAL